MTSSHKPEENSNCNKGLDASTKLILTKNKLSLEISQDDTEETISNHIKNGIFNFGLDLFFGSVRQNLEVIDRLKKAARRESELSGFSIPLAIYLKLSPRLQYTGRFKRNKKCLNMKLNKIVTLTANREYASKSCHSFIYVNAKFLMNDLKNGDIIYLGDEIQVKVIETKIISDHVKCQVIVPGVVKPRMRVTFPRNIEWDCLKISAEELEDITFAIGTNINVIVSYTSGNVEYSKQLHDSLAELKCDDFYLFTRLTPSCVKSVNDAEWISDAYDGFLLDCSDEASEDEIVKLSPASRALMEKCYHKKKPIFLQGCWSKLVDPSDYLYAFQFPDKYILPCENDFLRLFEAVFHKLSKLQFFEGFKHKKERSSLAMSTALASLDFQADCIVVVGSSGGDDHHRAVRISHFRPKATVLCVTTLASSVNYSSMYHNILTLPFDMRNTTEISDEDEIYEKCVYGMRYALLKKLVDSCGVVILVFCSDIDNESSDKIAVIKINNNYEETIRNVIWN